MPGPASPAPARHPPLPTGTAHSLFVYARVAGWNPTPGRTQKTRKIEPFSTCVPRPCSLLANQPHGTTPHTPRRRDAMAKKKGKAVANGKTKLDLTKPVKVTG